MNKILWILLPVSFLGAIASHTFAAETSILILICLLTMLGSIVGLIVVSYKNFQKQTLTYGLNSAIISLLVLALLGVSNYLANQNLGRFDLDLTKNKVHTLSDQTTKLVKNLKSPLKMTLFGNPGDREKMRVLNDKMRGLSAQVMIEFADFNREVTRVKQAGIKRSNTLILSYNSKDQKVEDPTEEKIANALSKLLQEKSKTICFIKGHGEKALTGSDAEGLMSIAKGLKDQGYETVETSLFELNQVPANCDGLLIAGPVKPYFEKEVKMLAEYLDQGGRAIFLLDVNLKGSDYTPELTALLEKWFVRPLPALVVDPIMQRLGGDAATIQIQTYSKSHPITKDFQIPTAFQLVRPLEVMTGAPAGLQVEWLAQTLPTSWGETDLKGLSSGAVSNNKGTDKQGPLSIGIAVDGKSVASKATKKTRIIVFGNSGFAANSFSRFGGNLDFALNSFSWLVEDENTISVRAREEDGSKLELDSQQGTLIFWITVVLIPLIFVIVGVAVWWRRRGL